MWRKIGGPSVVCNSTGHQVIHAIYQTEFNFQDAYSALYMNVWRKIGGKTKFSENSNSANVTPPKDPKLRLWCYWDLGSERVNVNFGFLEKSM